MIPVAVVLVILSYFMGNISPATLLARAQGIDIKKEGSGNAGTTNVLRVMGKKAALITLIIDIGKGFIASKFGYLIMFYILAAYNSLSMSNNYKTAAITGIWCGLAVFIGHVWPIILNFKGGKGVATSLGVILANDWKIALICLGVFVIAVLVTRWVSLGSILAAVTFVVMLFVMKEFNWIEFLPFMMIAIILVIKHRANISRILKGTESKLSFGSKKEDVK